MGTFQVRAITATSVCRFKQVHLAEWMTRHMHTLGVASSLCNSHIFHQVGMPSSFSKHLAASAGVEKVPGTLAHPERWTAKLEVCRVGFAL
jgi:hypothetical protein